MKKFIQTGTSTKKRVTGEEIEAKILFTERKLKKGRKNHEEGQIETKAKRSHIRQRGHTKETWRRKRTGEGE